MIPFLHFGPLSIPTFGLMVATGLLAAGFVMHKDFLRRGSGVDAFLVIGIAGLVGIAGARLYHVLEPEVRPELFAHPASLLFSRYGFAWFGGLLGGFIALALIAAFEKIPVLEFLDSCAPAACVGYAIGRIGCLLSGDGDYGIPTTLPWGMSFPNGVVPTTDRVHPTPLYEFIAWMLIALILWKAGSATIRNGAKTRGKIFCHYLLLTGVARFLVETIRINPRSFFGVSNAQAASAASLALGLIVLAAVSRKPRTA